MIDAGALTKGVFASVELYGIHYVSASAVASQFGVSRHTLWRWRRDRKIPPGYRFRNGQIYFTLQDCEAIMEHANRMQPTLPGEADANDSRPSGLGS